MPAGRDDDALSWDGDDDPTLDVGDSAPAPARPLPEGYTAVGRGADSLSAESGVTDAAPEQDAAGPAGRRGEAHDGAAPAAPDADGERGSDDADAAPQGASMGNATLVTLGVLGGVYALFTIGWVIGGLRLQGVAQYLVADVMFQGSLWLAVLAPLLWFATVFLLTRRARPWLRIVWLAAGVVLLLPWPFVMIGTVGQ